jgi:uncharacterized SAM-binding protein YcdF (DUF218 family)
MSYLKKQQFPELQGQRRKRSRLSFLIIICLVILAVPAAPHFFGRKLPGPPSDSADAVVVLTGGRGRIAEGYNAWRAQAGRDLCILGAGKGASLAQILPVADALSDEERSRILVEGWSTNTLENAFSARSVSEDRKYSSIILVTSDYHIPRAYYLFRKILPPGIDISVLRVSSDKGSPEMVWRWARMHFTEGWKYWGYRLFLLWE